MSLYREARSSRRRLWLAGAGAVVLMAAIAVVVVARSGEPSQAEQLESLQDDVRPALAALELVPIHYESANPTTHAAAEDQLEVADETIAGLEDDLRALDPAATDRVLSDLAGLRVLVRTTGRTSEIERATAAAAERLRNLVRLD